jgi:hypothetical protein
VYQADPCLEYSPFGELSARTTTTFYSKEDKSKEDGFW